MEPTTILLSVARPDEPGRDLRRWLGDPASARRISILNGHASGWATRAGGGAFSVKWAAGGRIRYRLDRASHVLAADGMMLVNAGQPYEMAFEGAAESFCLFFPPSLVSEAAGGRPLGEFPNLVFRPGFAPLMRAIRAGIAVEAGWSDDLEARLLLVLGEAVAEARRHRGEAERTAALKASTQRHLRARLEVARALIADGEAARLDQVAQAAGLSKHHLVRLFAAVFGTTPMKYAEHLRLDRAAFALRGSGLPIDEIAYAAGYGSAFGRAFRRRFGVSATAYRQAARN